MPNKRSTTRQRCILPLAIAATFLAGCAQPHTETRQQSDGSTRIAKISSREAQRDSDATAVVLSGTPGSKKAVLAEAAGLIVASSTSERIAYILTAKHAVIGTTIVVQTHSHPTVPHLATVIARSPSSDLALLATDLGNETHPPIHFSRTPPSKSDNYVIVGHPNGQRWTTSYAIGLSDGMQRSIVGTASRSDLLALQCMGCNRGDSGGPIFDRTGNVDGILVKSSQPDDVGASTIIAESASTIESFVRQAIQQ